MFENGHQTDQKCLWYGQKWKQTSLWIDMCLRVQFCAEHNGQQKLEFKRNRPKPRNGSFWPKSTHFEAKSRAAANSDRKVEFGGKCRKWLLDITFCCFTTIDDMKLVFIAPFKSCLDPSCSDFADLNIRKFYLRPLGDSGNGRGHVRKLANHDHVTHSNCSCTFEPFYVL